MEQIISSNDNGVCVENNNSTLALYKLKMIVVFEKYLREKIPGTEFDAGKINCTWREKRAIKNRITAVHGWVKFIQIGDEEIILTPSLKAIDDIVTIDKITQNDLERYARQARIDCSNAEIEEAKSRFNKKKKVRERNI